MGFNEIRRQVGERGETGEPNPRYLSEALRELVEEGLVEKRKNPRHKQGFIYSVRLGLKESLGEFIKALTGLEGLCRYQRAFELQRLFLALALFTVPASLIACRLRFYIIPSRLLELMDEIHLAGCYRLSLECSSGELREVAKRGIEGLEKLADTYPPARWLAHELDVLVRILDFTEEPHSSTSNHRD